MIRPAIHVYVCVALIIVAFVMAKGVDQGWTRGWASGWRALYVGSMMLGILYGVVGGAHALKALVEGEPKTSSVWRSGYFQLMAAGVLAFTLAQVGSELWGWSDQRVAAGILGVMGLGLGVFPPGWLWEHGTIVAMREVIGDVGVRCLYIGLGLLFVSAATLGWPSALLD
jgi:hypothetical protein